jgi:hypothetical protein
MNLNSVQDYFNKITEKITDKKTYYILLYIFISLFTLVLKTKPSFGFDTLNFKMVKGMSKFGLNKKMVKKISKFAKNTYTYASIDTSTDSGTSIGSFFQMIGLGYEELYFYLGFIIIYTILLVYLMYNRIEKCIEIYRKQNPKYANYTTKDFFINFATDVLYDAFTKTIKTLITPFIIFFIITIGYLIVNNVSKVVIPVKIVTSIVNYGMAIIFPIINCYLFFIYYILINLSC